MKTQQEVSAIFNQFAGREVSVVRKKCSLTLKSIGRARWTEYHLGEGNEQLISELKAAANESGLRLAIRLPRHITTADYVANRVNVEVTPTKGGKFAIKKSHTRTWGGKRHTIPNFRLG